MKAIFVGIFLLATLSVSVFGNDTPEHKMFARRLPLPSRDWSIKIDGITYSSIEELKRAVQSLPAGSKLTWYTSCFLFLEVPLGPKPRMKMAEFEKFCSEHHVTFTTNNEGSW